jgi:hypothetical protein
LKQGHRCAFCFLLQERKNKDFRELFSAARRGSPATLTAKKVELRYAER